MQELNASVNNLQIAALTAAIQAALPGKCFGVQSYGPSRPISVWLDNSASPADETTALNLIAVHDPVSLSVDKTVISANGSDAATVTISAPKQGAAAVTLLVSINGAAPTTWPIALTGGVGTDTITSVDPCIITISVQNPQNRSADTIKVQAI